MANKCVINLINTKHIYYSFPPGGDYMKFRKKPVVIEAYQTNKIMYIETLEGIHKENVGDWIITGVNGEQYPCKIDLYHGLQI